MTEPTGIDWDDAFANGPYIAQAETYPERWAAQAAAFRDKASGEIDIAYGAHPRARLDLFQPNVAPRGLAVILHGGYWLKFDKSFWSHLAEGALARGWAVATPSYPLTPETRLPEITRQIAQAITTAAQRVGGPIRLAGHSAGGHLATRMICQGAPLSEGIAARIGRVVSISGLHDLRPLRLTGMNAAFGLDAATAAAESPALAAPRPGVDATAWVGAGERPEFLRQSALLAEAWSRQGAQARLVAEPGRHHFDVIDGLALEDHPLTEAFAGS